MGNLKYIEGLIEKKLLGLHTAYLAKVLSVNGNTAKIQPLGLTKNYGEAAKAQSPLSSVPIIASARYRLSEKDIEVVKDVSLETENGTIPDTEDEYIKTANIKTSTETLKIAVLEPLKAGDVVVCVCCERDITEAIKGKNALPPVGHHQQSDSVIVGIL